MVRMSEEKTFDNVMELAGKPIRFARPSQGQVEALVRIGYGLRNAENSMTSEFWTKQLHRMGTLLDSLIHPDDQEAVDNMYLVGDVDHAALIRAVMDTLKDQAEDSENRAIAKAKKSNPARVRRD